jgi:hypothetical protein
MAHFRSLLALLTLGIHLAAADEVQDDFNSAGIAAVFPGFDGYDAASEACKSTILYARTYSENTTAR